ncbi:MAG: hypothetical protein ACJ75N_16660, partial [Actinomycetes bacterium]
RVQALQQHQGNIVAGDLSTAKVRLTRTRPLPGASVRWPGLTIVHRFGAAGSGPRPPPSVRLGRRGGLLMP